MVSRGGGRWQKRAPDETHAARKRFIAGVVVRLPAQGFFFRDKIIARTPDRDGRRAVRSGTRRGGGRRSRTRRRLWRRRRRHRVKTQSERHAKPVFVRPDTRNGPTYTTPRTPRTMDNNNIMCVGRLCENYPPAAVVVIVGLKANSENRIRPDTGPP